MSSQRERDPLQRWLVDRTALLITILDDRKPAGFAMVARETHAARQCRLPHGRILHRPRAAAAAALGRSAVRLILDRFAGRWEIVEYTRNPAAVQFWRNVVAGYTRGDYRERIRQRRGAPVLHFGPAARHLSPPAALTKTRLAAGSSLLDYSIGN